LATSERRFPSRREFGRLVLSAAFIIHFWAVLQFLYRLPALRLSLPMPQILAVLAYVLSAALAETLFASFSTAALAAALPRRVLRLHFLPAGVLLVYLSEGWVTAFHYLPALAHGIGMIWRPSNPLHLYLGVLGGIMLSYAALVLRVPYLVRRYPVLRQSVEAFVERVTPLSALFLLADLPAILTVFIRSLT